jgi:hypothetical protein
MDKVDLARSEDVMAKKKFIISILVCLGLIAGCVPVAANPTVVIPTVDLSTATNTPEPQVVVVTATPESPTETAVQLATPTPDGMAGVVTMEGLVLTDTPSALGIAITKIEDLGNGRAMVYWSANGDFPSGFQVVWSSTNQMPTYPQDTNAYYGDPNARTAIITGDVGKIYYVRVCRVTGDGCDMYSNLGIFALFPNTPTPTLNVPTGTKTALANSGNTGGTASAGNGGNTSYNALGTPVSSTNVIVIVVVKDAGTGKAYIQWTASANSDGGFGIAMSKTDKTPTYKENRYFFIDDGKARSAYVDGVTGESYYIRVCRIVGKTCDVYSAAVQFTFAGKTPTPTPKSATADGSTITISGFSNISLGQATLSWTPAGAFPNGFRIMYSDTNKTPTSSDTTASAGSGVTSVTVYGIPGVTYYFRVCKLVSSACTIYSSVANYYFAPEISLTPTSGDGLVSLTWTNSGSDPATGYVILRAAGSTDPYGASWYDTVGNTTLAFNDNTVTSGNTYTYRVCGYDGTDISSCSLPQTIAYVDTVP